MFRSSSLATPWRSLLPNNLNNHLRYVLVCKRVCRGGVGMGRCRASAEEERERKGGISSTCFSALGLLSQPTTTINVPTTNQRTTHPKQQYKTTTVQPTNQQPINQQQQQQANQPQPTKHQTCVNILVDECVCLGPET